MYVPVPDIIDRPSEALRQLVSAGRVPHKAARALSALSLDASVKDIKMSLREVFVIDNRDPGKGDIYLVTSVTDSIAAEPFTLTVQTFEDIPDKARLELGPAGLAIYRNPDGKKPRFLDYRILVVESDQGIRDAGDILKAVHDDPEYKAHRDAIIAAIGLAQPAVGLITASADVVIGVVARVLKMNRDDQLIYIAGSYDDAFDDLGVKYGLAVQQNHYAKVSYQVEAR